MNSSYSFAGGAGGNAPAPSDEVTAATSPGASPAAGTSDAYARGDHSHGTPPLPAPADIGAAATGHTHAGAYDPAGTAAAEVTAHSGDTADVHGIPDTTALETTTGAAGKVSAHAAAADPHGDRAYTDTAVSARLAKAANLSDVTNAATALTNLGGVPASRQITTGVGLGGGATLASDVHLEVDDPDFLTHIALLPAGRYESRSRHDCGVQSSSPTSGTLHLTPIWLPSGVVVSDITHVSGTVAGASLTNQWFALFNSDRVMLARTSNDGTAAWGTGTAKTLPITTTAAGAASSYTTTYAGLHYIGLLVTATTPPSICGAGSIPVAMASAAPSFGNANTGLTTPPAFPFTANVPNGAALLAYAYVS